MTNYGETIRKIRLNKGFSQKEIYTGIVSKSYAIEFEKGKHDMGVTSFVKILERLYLNFEEFSFIHNNYQQKPESGFLARYADAANQGNMTNLKQIETELEDNKNEHNRLIVALVRLTIYSLEHPDTYLFQNYPPKDVKLLQDFLMRLDSWTFQEIMIFINGGIYFDYKVRCHLMKTVTKKITKYQEFNLYGKAFSALIVNFLGDAFMLEDQPHIIPYLVLLDELTRDITLSFQRDFYLFYTGLYDILWGNKEAGEECCHAVILHLKRQDHQYFAQMLTKSLESICLKKNN